MACALSFLWVLIVCQCIQAQTYAIDTKAKWNKWTIPKGIVDVGSDGWVKPVATRMDINAALDATQFLWYSEEEKKMLPGGASAESNQSMAGNVVDGRYDTYWQPDAADSTAPSKWVLKVNLGRVVAATAVRLVFADTLGRRPFEQFAVYVSEGAILYPGADVVPYRLVGKTTLPNRLMVVEYPLRATEMHDTTKTGIARDVSVGFSQVQYVRVVFGGMTPGAALAEVEVDAVGDNIALGTLARYGSIDAHTQGENGPLLFDGNAGTVWLTANVPDTEWNSGPISGSPKRAAGAWFEWDLGATFWVRQMTLFFGREGRFGKRGAFKPDGYIIQVSDGSARSGGVADVPGGRFNYVPLVDVWNRDMPYRYQFEHAVDPARRVRYILWRHAHGTGIWGRGEVTLFEMEVHGQGFPAEVVMTSSLSDADLIKAAEGKHVTEVRWDATVPTGAKLEIQSRSGNEVIPEKRFFNSSKKEVSEKEYRRLPASLRGDSVVTVTPGLGWSDWSDVYARSGGPFQSPSPRQYLQFRVKMISDLPDVAPSLRSLSVKYTSPFVKEARGVLRSSEATIEVDKPTRFAYGVLSRIETGNRGVDRILIRSSATLDTTGLVVEKRARIAGVTLSQRGDSLVVQLPRSELVREDSTMLTLRFTAKVRKNATVFDAFVGNSTAPDVWQLVDPAQRDATTVFVKSLSERETLFGNVVIEPSVFTPNGDDVNDNVTVGFALLKVEGREPRVAIYSTQGRLMRELVRSPGAEYRYVWDGQSASRSLVQPGVYVCRISVDAQAGKMIEERTIGVVY